MRPEMGRSDLFRSGVTRATFVTIAWIAMFAYSAAMWFLFTRNVMDLVR